MTSQSSITSASGTLSVDSLLFGHVKEKNPCLLTQLFPSHQNDRQEAEAARMAKQGSIVQRQVMPIAMKGDLYSEDKMHRRFCRLSDPQTSVNLVVFNYFHLRGDHSALKMLFDEETRENFAETIEKMDVPTVLRLTAHRRKEILKVENKRFPAISKCQLCRKCVKGSSRDLTDHIGMHEEIASYCFVEGCDRYFKRFNSFTTHLLAKHQMYQKDFTPDQYYQLQSMRAAYHKKAALCLDKYFPAELFIGVSDRKTKDTVKLEDVKCLDCGAIAKSGPSRRLHVSTHMNLSYDCAVEGCPAATNPTSFASHLRNHHSKKIGQLNVTELHRHKQNKIHFNAVMKTELPKYFPKKSDGDEE